MVKKKGSKRDHVIRYYLFMGLASWKIGLMACLILSRRGGGTLMSNGMLTDKDRCRVAVWQTICGMTYFYIKNWDKIIHLKARTEFALDQIIYTY